VALNANLRCPNTNPKHNPYPTTNSNPITKPNSHHHTQKLTGNKQAKHPHTSVRENMLYGWIL